MSDPAVAILPYELRMRFAPGRIACDALHWPLGQPDRLKGRRLADMAPRDHLVVFPRNSLHFRPTFGTPARVSMMVMEPAAIHARHLRRLRWSHRRFFRVLGHHRPLVDAIPNGVFVPLGTTWVPDWQTRDTTKSRMCSLIASAKRTQAGHALRHEIAAWVAAEGCDVAVMGGGYAPFAEKALGLAPYRYSVVIENVREPDYFTEKLIDALLCRTVPIYWGCPNIGDYIDTRGLMVCDSGDTVKEAIRTMSEEDYAARLPALDRAREQAATYVALERRAAEALLAESAAQEMPS